MAQHFLLSADARTLKLRDIYRMSDDAAFEAFDLMSGTAFEVLPHWPGGLASPTEPGRVGIPVARN